MNDGTRRDLKATFSTSPLRFPWATVEPLPGRGHRAARVIAVAVIAGYAVSMLINQMWSPGHRYPAVFIVCLAGIFALQFAHSIWESPRSPRWVRVTTIGIQATLTYLPLLWVPPWGSMAGFLAGSLLLLVSGWLRWGLYALAGAAALPSALVWNTPVADTVWLIESSLLTGLVVYGVSSLAALVVAADVARAELARLAIVREQLRVDRELHDVVGRSLSAIARCYGLVAALLASDEGLDQAKEELAAALKVTRKALADVRAVARNYRQDTLRAELERAATALTSVGIETTVEVSGAPPAPDTDALLATLLREVVANVLGLGPGSRCLVEVTETAGRVSMRVLVEGMDDPVAGRDLGLDRLSARLAAAGATLTSETDSHGVFRFAVEVPAGTAPETAEQDPAGPEPGQPVGGQAAPAAWAPRTAVVLMTVVLSAYALVTAVFVLADGISGGGLAGFAVCFATVFLLQVAHSAGVTARRPHSVRIMSLVVQAVATYVPLLWLGQQWAAMAGFLAGSFLLLVRDPWRWVLYAAVAGSIAVTLGLEGLPAISIVYGGVFTLLTGLIVYAMTSLQALVVRVRAAQEPLVRMAVVQERLRVARDLHDLLSYSLLAISLKTELTYRLLPGNVDRARKEVAELVAVTGQALEDVRHSVGGHPGMSLAAEAESAQSTLAASGIEGTVDVSCGELPREAETVLAIVLREATTNILRHSKAEEYVIRVTRRGTTVELRVANDGAGDKASGSGPGGAGLQNLESRLRGIGGELTARRHEGGWFVLTGIVPATPGRSS